ncbi:hypothetical protein Fcan01_15188 [Folsomia candida]|uniref:Uncharacterized protein n=1 Tax=Folsomia candida TaxID=158441 RepID=A0A226DY86_FOLCA|nr:hypothetical protein Fcan01_15188 [Folsomia candida]
MNKIDETMPPAKIEEEVTTLFHLSMPRNWRNSITNPPDLGFQVHFHQSPNEEQRLTIKTFWNDVHLGSYAQLDFDLGLTISDWSRSPCRRQIGGLLYNAQHSPSPPPRPPPPPPPPISQAIPEEDEEEEEEGDEGDSRFLKFHAPPPNDLQLSNLLRLAFDCPFPEGKGGLVPTALNDGPSSFIPLSECPDIDGDGDPPLRMGTDDDAIVESCFSLALNSDNIAQTFAQAIINNLEGKSDEEIEELLDKKKDLIDTDKKSRDDGNAL